MKNPMHYRNKLQYPIGLDNEGKPVMGVYASRTHNIIPVGNCLIQNQECQNIANSIFEYVEENNISVYDEKTLKGMLRHIVVKIGIKTNEIMVILVLNNQYKIDYLKLIEHITKKYPNIKTIVKNINNKNTNVILGDKNEIIYGDGYIHDVLGEYKFKISATSFYQTNPIQTEILYNTAINYIVGVDDSVHPDQIALDLYCGIGTIGIFASKHFKKVYGIEINEQAIQDAKENAKLNNISNIEFIQGDVGAAPVSAQLAELKPDVVFVDPPRKGLDNYTIETLLNIQPKQIIYISCNPATLARDIARLEEKYKLEQIQPIDMFPYSKHVETVCLLTLQPAKK